MNYYPHHIGDFIRDTANLSNDQLATYMRMIWAYYLSEKPYADAPEDIAFAMRSDEKTVALLLRHYFTLQEDGWHQKRIDIEIAAFKTKGEKRAAAANARWSNANALQSESNSKKKHANQEPVTNNQISNTTASPDGFAEFYQKYPKKVGRPAAEKAFKAAKASQHTSIILLDIDRRLDSGDWSLEKRQFIPNPATYLNQRRWEDTVDEPSQNPMFAGML